MSRLPWNRHHSHGVYRDEGGMEHLETDVMRFMAILALCLVAIFALVQSMPMTKTLEASPPAMVAAQAPTPPKQPVQSPEPRSIVEHPAVSPPDATAAHEKVVVLRRKDSARPATSRPTPAQSAPPVAPVPEEPARVATLERQPVTIPDSPATAPPEKKRGFSLRFASDEALLRLVASGEVDLFAFSDSRVWQLIFVDSRLTFRTAQVPGSFHEMAADTVPDEVLGTLRRFVSVVPARLKWGVTLPGPTSAALARLVSTSDGGSLVIDENGFLRLDGG